jgi:hypothetical protein
MRTGFVAKLGCGQKDAGVACNCLCSEPIEVLGKRRSRIPGAFRLSFADHVDHLDPAENRASTIYGLEPEYRSHSALDAPMVLFDTIIQVSDLSYPDRLELPV